MKDHFSGWLSYGGWGRGQILCKCGPCFTSWSGWGTAVSAVHVHSQTAVPAYLGFFPIIINICLNWCQLGQDNRRKNQGLLTTRGPCDTALHSTKEVRVLLPSVWFTREKEREKVVMLLRCLASHARNKGQHHLTSWRLFHSTNQPGDQPWWEGGTGRLASAEKVTRALPARAAGWQSSLWSELRHMSTTRKTCVSVCMCVREVGFRENYLEGSKMHRGNPMS